MLKTDQEYKNQIKEVGNYNLINTNKWRERAIFFQENGYYTELVEETHDWLKFWEEEENRIMNGIWIDNFYIPGLYYFYLNYLPIYRKQDNKFDFPDVYDSDYHTFLCLEHAEFLKLDFAVIKKRQSGFEQPYSEPILTLEGWKTMGDLKLKDKLYDNLGNIVEVDAIYEQGEKDVYEIELLDKRKVRCGIEHLWKVIDRRSRNKSEKVMSLKDILEKDIIYNVTAPTKNGIKNYKGYRFSINEIQSIPFTSKDLKIPPYVLGCLLGDGSFSKTQIRLTSMDNEIFDNVIQLLGEDFYYGNKELDVNNSSWRCTIRYKKRFDNETNKDFVNFKYGVNPLNRYISFYNLDTTNTYTKFIPLDYLHSSFEDRLELLQGLMDTDGYINEKGQDIHYTTVSEKLAKDVAYLCRSMGINCTIDKKAPQKENHSFFYRVRIKSKFPLFKLKRKLERQKPNKNYRKSIPIISINKLDYKEQSRCISVTGENKMYITTDFIPTHNTLKLCTPLIRELFFSRGSPNYIATYEEAQVLKTWTEVIEPYREHINSNTPWYRDFNPSKPLNWRVAKEVINEQGKKLVQGRKNTLKGLVLSKSVSKGVGGCNLKGTLIKMANGQLEKVENIKIGDYVIGKDGLSKKVLTLFSGTSEMFEVSQSKGINYVVTPNHKLHLFDQKNNSFLDIEVQDFIKLSNHRKYLLNGIKHKGIIYSENNINLYIDPYYLGLYLGDGHKGKYSIIVNKTKDKEIFDYIKELAIKEDHDFSCLYRNLKRPEYNDEMYDLKLNSKIRKKGYTYNFEKFGLKIKHIPLVYKQSSINQRLELLAGLLDSDGYYNHKKARFELGSKYDVLFKDIAELCTDLGFTIYKGVKTHNGKKSTVFNKETKINVIYIKGELWKIPTKVKRKIVPNIKRKNSEGKSKLKIANYGVGEYYGFECEDHLYILEDGTITHNSGKYIFHDEAGVSPVVSKFVGYVKPMITYGNTKTGTIIISGAVGELKHLEGGLKEYITKPDENGFYSVDNVWDVDNEFSGRKCGFFVPESWAYHGIDDDPDSDFYGQSFIDKWGNSKVKEAERYIKKLRKGEIPGKPIELDKFSISQTPLTLSECFQYRDENIFPTELINPQIEKVNKKENHGIYIDLYETEKKEVKHKLLNKYDHHPVLEHPIDPKNQKKKEGVIQIWEMPLSEKPPYGVYWAGVDIVRDSTSINSPSLNCIFIYKGAHSLKNEYNEKIIVAKYMARPKDKMDWFKKAILLLEFYNAEALVENNVNWFIEESIKINKQYKIAKTPQWVKDMTPQGTSYITKPYGVVMTPKLKEKIIDAISRYIKEPIHTEYNEITGEPTQHFGIERINDIQLLRELINFRTDSGNFDSIISFGLVLLQAEYNEIRGVVIKNNNENLKLNKKNLNLLMSNRFTRTNLKKLANANNI